MRVTGLSIENYRSIRSASDIKLGPHTVLVGGNNAGKSNILSALDLILGARAPWRIRLDPDDYFDQTRPVEIRATLGEIDASDKGKLYPLCNNQNQRGALNSRDDLEIEINLVVPAWEPQELESDEEQEDEETPTKVELKIKLWGFNVFRKLNDVRQSLVRAITVSPHRRPDSDLNASRWSPYGQLTKEVLENSHQYESLRTKLSAINEEIQSVFADEKQKLLEDARVVSYVDDINFRLTEHGNPVELLRNLKIFVSEGGRESNIDHVGTGTQSAVIIAMFELVLHSTTGQVRVLCIEEPEAFIHPHGVRHMGRLLRSVAEEKGSQVLLASHSPSLVSTLRPADIARVVLEDGETKVYQADGNLDSPHFARYVTPDTAEMFFADRVVLVEGDTERFLLPPLASLVEMSGRHLNLDRERISIISMGSKDNVLNYLKILETFSIDTWAILDADFLSGSSLNALIKHLESQGATIDLSTEAKLRRSLLKKRIIVLSKGEIEDYITDVDVAAVSGKTLTEVQTILSAHQKRGSGFKAIFGTAKPQYAMLLANHYVSKGSMPPDLERLIKTVAS